MAVTVLDHPLAGAILTSLRDSGTEPPQFRRLAQRLALMLTVEATRGLETVPRRVETPLEPADGVQLASPLVAVPILRAGLGMLDAVVELVPDVAVGYIGLERDHATFEPRSYYTKLPPLEGVVTLLLDPMLATGGSASAACSVLRQHGARRVALLSVVGAPAGIVRMARDHPDVDVVLAAVDSRLDEHAYIRPGLGDFGDRLFAT